MIVTLRKKLRSFILAFLLFSIISPSLAQDCNDILSVRPVENTYDNCGSWCNSSYVFTLGTGNCYTAGGDLTFTEYTDGTALLSGSVVQNGNIGQLSVIFNGRTFETPANSPKYGLCINTGGADWYYYTQFTGTFTAPNGSTINMTRSGPAFQVGYGGNLQETEYGAAGWFFYSIGANAYSGDLNFQLGAQVECIEDGIYLEAECATVGSLFETHSDSEASNNDYLTVAAGNNSLGSVPSNTADRVSFSVTVSRSGAYNIFARVKAPSGGDDSFWVRANNGNWIKWNEIEPSSSFVWDQIHDNNNSNIPVSFYLVAGDNTIDFAYREDGTLLDKIYISLDADTPSGVGQDAQNCECLNVININCIAVNNICGENENIGVNLEISGSSQNYSILWSNGATTQNISNVDPGTYSVTVTGDEDCTATCETTLIDYVPFSIVCESTNASCGNGGSGTVTVTGGTAPYIYHWSNDACTAYAEGLEAGIYSITVTDNNGCEEICSFEVLYDEPTITVTGNATNNLICGVDYCSLYCFESATGNDAVSAQMSISYSESGDQITIRTVYAKTFCDNTYGQNVIGWPGNNHKFDHLRGSDKLELALYNGDGVESLGFKMDYLHNYNGIYRTGGINDGDGEMLNGDPAYILDVKTSISENLNTYGYVLLTDSPATDANYSTNPNYPNWIYEMWYEVTIDANAFGSSGFGYPEIADFHCSPSKSGISAEPLILIGCCGSNCNGSIDLTVTEGDAPFTYLWSNGETTEDIDGLCAGTYTVTVLDANGCSIVLNYEVDQVSPIELSCMVTEPSCDQSAGGSITTTVTGDIENYTFLWSNGATSQNLNDLEPGTYSVTVSDINGCSASCETTIQQFDPITISCSSTNTSCGNINDGTVSVSVSGGVAPYSYEWNNGNDSNAQSNLAAGSYTVIVTDANGCEASCSAEVLSDTPVSVTCAVQNNTCDGSDFSSISTQVSGGSGSYTFSWSNGSTTPVLENISAGNYSVTVTDQNGCISVGEATIGQLNPFSIDCASTNTSCGNINDGTVSVSVSGGVAPYSYTWDNGNDSNAQSNLAAGSYTVIVTDANGCEASCSVEVISDTPVSVTCAVQNNTCDGSDFSSVSAQVSGGSGSYTFSWSNGSTAPILENIGAGNYSVTVTDQNGCISVGEATIGQLNPFSIDCASTNTSCGNIDDGTVSVSVSGGVAPYSYEWNNGNDSNTQADLSAGTYTVIVTDANGCEASCSVEVISDTPVSVTCAVQNNTCDGSDFSSVSAQVSGGSGSYTFSWSNGSTAPVLENIGAGNYSVTVTDQNGCVAIGEAVIGQLNPFSIDCASTNTSCGNIDDGTVSVSVSGGVAPYSYTWDNGNDSNAQADLSAGTYTVIVTDANGCEASCSVEVISDTPVSVTCAVQNNTCDGSDFSSVSAQVSGGSGSYTFSWSNGNTAPFLENISAGNYSVTVTDLNGCVAVGEAVIGQLNPFSINCSSTNTSCGNIDDGTVSVSVSGGVAPYSYTWDNGNNSNAQADLSAGTYTVIVTDANGCEASCSMEVISDTPVSVTCAVQNNTCDGSDFSSVSAQVSGGSGSYTFSWSNGSTAPVLENISAGNYSVTVTDLNGCVAVGEAVIGQLNPFSINCSSTNTSCGNINDGTVSVSVSGGVAPYSYEWNNGNDSNTQADLAAGSYTVIVTDANGCEASCSVEVLSDTPVSVTCAVQNNTCDGSDFSSISAQVSGGSGNYTFSWSNGSTTPVLENIGAGNYSVTVTDLNGCVAVGEAVIGLLNPFSIACSSTNTSCGNIDDGTVSVSVSGGVAPYSYTWDNGNGSNTQSNLAAGSYTVIVTDANGCEASCSLEVLSDTPVSVTCAVQNNTCDGSDFSSISAQVSGGSGNYTFSWSNGSTTPVLENIGAGNYSVTVTDLNGCVAVGEAVIGLLNPFSINCSSTNTSCGNINDGTVSVSVNGGVAPYSYTWDNGNNSNAQSNLAAGSYTVIVTDANGCEASCSMEVLSDTPVSVTCAVQNNTCDGSDFSSVSAQVSGGSGSYTFSWSNGSTTPVLENIGAGNYSVTVTDLNGCVAVGEAVIGLLNPFSIACSSTNTSCGNIDDGTVSVSVSGGVAPYSYTWDNGNGSNTQSNLAAGSYTVIVTDANGCEASCSLEVLSDTPVSVTCAVQNNTCDGSDFSSVSAQVSGGSGNYTFSWSNGSTTPVLENISSGNYSVTVTDQNGCISVGEATIGQLNPFSIDCASTNTSCGNINDGTVSVSVNGGVAPYSYTWNNGNDSNAQSNLAAGSYTVIVTDANGCEASCSVEVLSDTPVSVTCAVQNNTCQGNGYSGIFTQASGGSGNYTFLWSNGATTQNIENIEFGTYSLTVTDSNGCEAICESIVEGSEALNAVCEATNLLCGEANTGSVSVSVTGGLAPYSFQWSNGANTQNIDNVDKGTYQVTVTDANGCVTTCEAQVIKPAPIIVISTATPLACFGDNTSTASFTITGGTPPYTYLWDNGSTEPVIENLGAGFYGITVTDANGCTGICGPWVESPEPIEVLFENTKVNCFGGNDGTISTLVSGGTGTYTFEWSNGATTQNLYDLVTGDYTLTVSDNNGCTNVFTTTIESNTNISILCTSTPLSCHQDNSGSIQVSVTGGSGSYIYAWNNGATSQNLENITNGFYNVTVTDENDCTATCSSSVETPALLSISCIANDLVCAASGTGYIEINIDGGTGPYTYQWSNGATTQNISNLDPGIYNVIVTDANGCFTGCETTINAAVALTATCNTQDLFCGEVNAGEITVSVEGGTAPFSFEWSNGQTTQNLSGLSEGTYEVTITDAKGCNTVCSSTINAVEPLSISCQGQDLLCGDANSGNIEVSLSGGSAPYTYEWSNGATTQNLTDVNEGNYSVTVTDLNGCTATCETTVSYISPLMAICTTQDLECGMAQTGSVNLTVTGGSLPYSFLWNNGQTTEDLNNLNEGNYTVMVTDANGCTTICSSAISATPALEVSCTAENVTCGNSDSGNVDIEVTGGEAPFTFEWSNGMTTEDLLNVPNGNYTVMVTDANGCIAFCGTTVEVSIGLDAACVATGTQCGEETTGSIDLTVSGGTGIYTYTWSNGETTEDLSGLDTGSYSVTVTDSNGCTGICSTAVETSSPMEVSCSSQEIPCGGQFNGSVDLDVSGGSGNYAYEWSNGETTEDITDVPAGTYEVTVTDSNGCTATCANTVSEAAGVSVSCVKTNISCKNAHDGSIDVTVSGGVEPYTFNWSNGSVTEDLTNLSKATYTITVTDANGCSSTCTSNITEPANLLVIAYGNNISCNGVNDGTAFATVIGGTVPYSYAWSNGATSPFINALAAGSYTLTVTDAHGCQNFGVLFIEEPEVLNASCSAINEICQPATGAIDLNVTGGTAPYSFNWSNDATTEDLFNIIAGTYSVTVTDAKGCTTVCSSTVESSNLIVLSSIATNASCGTPSVGSIDLTVTGGTGPFFYQWSNGISTEDNLNIPAGTYTVTVTDATGCSHINTSIIEDAPSISIELSKTNVVCNGVATGSIDLTVDQGFPPFTYQWSNGATTANIDNLNAGAYSVTVSDANGCQGIASATISQPSKLLAICSSNPINCNGGTDGTAFATAIGGAAPYQFAWSNGATFQFINALSAGSYMVTVTDANGCSAVSLTTIAEPAPIEIVFTNNQLVCQGDNNGSIETTVSGGQAPYTYQWSNGESTAAIDGLSAGNYTVIVTDNKGCITTGSTTIEATNPLIVNCLAQGVLCAGESDGQIDLEISGGVQPYTFAWSNGSTDMSIHDLSAGQYDVTVTDANGCATICSSVVEQPEHLSANYGSIDITCPGELDGILEAAAHGGVPPYSYEWSTGDITETVEGLPAGAYGLTLTDANGCIFICGLIINEPDLITCSNEVIAANSGNPDVYDLIISANGGTGSYQYSIDNGNTYQSSATFTDLEAGTYTVLIADENGCMGECGSIEVSNPNLGLADNTSTGLSPNPAQDEMMVAYETSVEAFTIFEVKNMTGEVIYTKEMITQAGENTFLINTTNYASGTYVLAIYTEKGVESSQFVVLKNNQ